MSIQYLLVTFPEQRGVLADEVMVGVTNHILMLPADEYAISLEGDGYAPASQDVPLDGTSVVKPMLVAFTAAAGGGMSGGVVANRPTASRKPSSTASVKRPGVADKTAEKPKRARRTPAKKTASTLTAAKGKRHA